MKTIFTPLMLVFSSAVRLMEVVLRGLRGLVLFPSALYEHERWSPGGLAVSFGMKQKWGTLFLLLMRKERPSTATASRLG